MNQTFNTGDFLLYPNLPKAHFLLENQVDIAQSNSELYSATGNHAPPLKKEKSIQVQGLGKGWFDLKVS